MINPRDSACVTDESYEARVGCVILQSKCTHRVERRHFAHAVMEQRHLAEPPRLPRQRIIIFVFPELCNVKTNPGLVSAEDRAATQPCTHDTALLQGPTLCLKKCRQ